jgi:hypothetical protein
MISGKLFPFVGAVWLLGWGAIILGVPGLVPFLHRTFRGMEPSTGDLKIARFVGYIGIVFGSIALVQGLIGLAH